MIKYIAIIFSIIGTFLITILGEDIDVIVNIPQQVNCGEDFIVEVEIIKGDKEPFARFQQDLPIGFTATPISTANGDWAGTGNTVKLIWLKVPSQDTLKIKYNVHVDQTISGTYSIGGVFSYVIDQNRLLATAQNKQIIVIPCSLVDDSTEIVNDVNSTLTCFRKRSVSPTSDKEFLVDLLVNKKDLGKDNFAKIQENVPPGYTAMGVETQGGIFTFKNNKAKFLWMTLPQEDEFQVSYKIVSNSIIDMKSVALNGSFSYIENGNTKSIYIVEKDFESLLADKTDTTTVNPIDTSVTGIPDPNKGVSYSVQICALRKYRNPTYFNSNRYNLPDKIKAEAHEGWNKYTIGSFTEYKDARDYRVNIWEKTIVDDAFVSAYNNGTRITVQEALMIASQKWYQ